MHGLVRKEAGGGDRERSCWLDRSVWASDTERGRGLYGGEQRNGGRARGVFRVVSLDEYQLQQQ